MDKESAYLLQCIDTNCNDCAFLQRLFGEEGKAATDVNGKTTVFYGHCKRKSKRVAFAPATCAPWNAECFVHRKDQTRP